MGSGRGANAVVALDSDVVEVDDDDDVEVAVVDADEVVPPAVVLSPSWNSTVA